MMKENQVADESLLKTRKAVEQLRERERKRLKMVLNVALKSLIKQQRKILRNQKIIDRLRGGEQNSISRQTEQELKDSKQEILRLTKNNAENEAKLQNEQKEKEALTNELEKVKKELEKICAHENNEREINQQEMFSLNTKPANDTDEFKRILSANKRLEEMLKENDVAYLNRELEMLKTFTIKIKKLQESVELAGEERRFVDIAFEETSKELICAQMKLADFEKQLTSKQAIIDDGLQREAIFNAKREQDQEVIVDLTTTVDNLENKLLTSMKQADDLKAEMKEKDAIFAELQKKFQDEKDTAIISAAMAEKLVQEAKLELETERNQLFQQTQKLQAQKALVSETGSSLIYEIAKREGQLADLIEEANKSRTKLSNELTKCLLQFTSGTRPVQRIVQRGHRINEIRLKGHEEIQSVLESARQEMRCFGDKLETILE